MSGFVAVDMPPGSTPVGRGVSEPQYQFVESAESNSHTPVLRAIPTARVEDMWSAVAEETVRRPFVLFHTILESVRELQKLAGPRDARSHETEHFLSESQNMLELMEGSVHQSMKIMPQYSQYVEYYRFDDKAGAYFLKNGEMPLALLQQYFTESFADKEIIELYPDLSVNDLEIARAFIVDLLG